MMRKKLLVNTLTALALLAASPVVMADNQRPSAYGPGYGMQPGMMGPGMMMGPRMGMGPGMMGMMDDGCPGGGMDMMGPGMGMGMMGMGPGMMMGPGMTGGYGPGALNLDEQQQKKITQIQDELRKKHWNLMGKMNDERVKLRDIYALGKRDPSAIGQQQQRIYDLRRQMLESSVEAQNRMEAVLVPEQKEQLRGYHGQGWMMW